MCACARAYKPREEEREEAPLVSANRARFRRFFGSFARQTREEVEQRRREGKREDEEKEEEEEHARGGKKGAEIIFVYDWYLTFVLSRCTVTWGERRDVDAASHSF